MNSLKKLLACTVQYQYNLQILHWKITGYHFDTIHSILEGYQNKLTSYVDMFGEMLIAVDDEPMTLKEIVKFIEDDDADYISINAEEYYDKGDVFKCIGYMFNHLIKLCDAVKTDNDLPSDIRAQIDGVQYELRIESKYKNKMRLK